MRSQMRMLSAILVAASWVSRAWPRPRTRSCDLEDRPNAGGANITQIPNYQLWAKELNDKGGMMVGGKRVPVEVIEYDDRSNSEEAVRAVELFR